MPLNTNIKDSGQTLLEALIALTAIIIVLSATSVAVLISINNASFVKQQNQSNKLAQQGVELIRDQIQNNNQYPTYLTYNGSIKCLDTNNVFQNRQCNSTISTSTDLTNGIFKREVSFTTGKCDIYTSDFTDGLQIKVDVYWTSGKCQAGNTFCHRQEVRSCFINPSKVVPTTTQGI